MWNAIVDNYQAVGFDDDERVCLLRKRKNRIDDQYECIGRIDSAIDGMVYLQNIDAFSIHTEMTFIGKLVKLLWKIPNIDIQIEYEDGYSENKRVILDNIDTIIIKDRYTHEDADNSYSISNIKFAGDGIRFYKKNITICYYNRVH